MVNEEEVQVIERKMAELRRRIGLKGSARYETPYALLYQDLVRLGVRPQHRKKYRP